VAHIIEDFEFAISSLTLRMHDDGRFVAFADGNVLYDKERTGKFPEYATDIKPKLARLGT
jgi:predicted Rdx family selenoprotein